MPEQGSLRILIVDDDPAMVTMMRQVILAEGLPAPAAVATGGDALALQEPFDIVLLDHHLPDAAGVDLLASLRSREGRPAVILVTGRGDETLAAAALRQGAEDYLIKDRSLSRLLPQVLERVRRTRALRSALAAAEADLVRVERLAAIGELSVTLHHEINNPLMSASVEVELLLEQTTDATARRSLESVRQALDRIRDVLKRVAELSEARTRSYVGDLAMIDINAPAPAAPAISRGDAVLWLTDDDLGRVIPLLLKQAGFAVERVSDAEALERNSARRSVSLVVLGQPTVGAAPLGGFQPPAERSYTLVALVQGDGSGERALGADHTIVLPFDPASFTAEVLGAMKRSGH